MESYFTEQMKKTFGLDLGINISFEFSNADGKQPNDHQITEFTRTQQMQIIDIVKRLNNEERMLFLQKLKDDMEADYPGFEVLGITEAGSQIEMEYPNRRTLVEGYTDENGDDITTYEINFSPDEMKSIVEKHSLYPMFLRVKSALLDTVDQLQKGATVTTKAHNKQTKTSYTWQSNRLEELPELHQKMIDAGLIAPDTDQQNFIKIFTGQPLDEITPVKWLDTQKLLAYFISRVTNKITGTMQGYWKKAERCFYPANNLKQTHQNNLKLDEYGRPKGYLLVDPLFD